MIGHSMSRTASVLTGPGAALWDPPYSASAVVASGMTALKTAAGTPIGLWTPANPRHGPSLKKENN